MSSEPTPLLLTSPMTNNHNNSIISNNANDDDCIIESKPILATTPTTIEDSVHMHDNADEAPQGQRQPTPVSLPRKRRVSQTPKQTRAGSNKGTKQMDQNNVEEMGNGTAGKAVVSIRVARSSLTNALGNGLSKFGLLDQISNLFKKRVLVEATPHGRFDNIFHAPFPRFHRHRQGQGKKGVKEGEVIIRPQKVKFLSVGFPAEDDEDDLVVIGDGFDVSVVGMSITPQDTFAHDFNELLLYSVHRADDVEARELVDDGILTGTNHDHSDSDDDHTKQQREKAIKKKAFMAYGVESGGTIFNNRDKKNKHSKNNKSNTVDINTFPLLRAGEVPRIHFDPLGDGYTAETLPDTFVSIPASTSRVLRRLAHSHSHTTDEVGDCVCSGVSLRFTVMEIDKVTQAQVAALAGLESGGRAAAAAGASLPFAGLLASAASVAAKLGRAELRRYARPDFVMSADVYFCLTPKRRIHHDSNKGLRREGKGAADAAVVGGGGIATGALTGASAGAPAASAGRGSGGSGVNAAADDADAGDTVVTGDAGDTVVTGDAGDTVVTGDAGDTVVTGDAGNTASRDNAGAGVENIDNEGTTHQEKVDDDSAYRLFSGDTYLRYGYYFFLHKPVDAQLYAQTNASAQTVPLLLRRADYTPKVAAKNQREFFPLAGVSYVVIRVTKLTPSESTTPTNTPVDDNAFSGTDPVNNAVRLQYILRLNSMLRSFAL